MIDLWIPQGSTYAADIDNLILFIGVSVGIWFVLTEGMFFYLLWKYRFRAGVPAMYVTGKEKHLKKWINVPHALIIFCDVFVIIGAVYVWYTVKQYSPETDVTVRIMGQQWAWSFQHPGPDNELDTDDDIKTVDELHIQIGKKYTYELESRDVLHSFSVPIFRLKQDAVPGRVITGWFEPTITGTYDIQCAEMCGIGHGIMAARIVIEDAEQHERWMSQAMSN
jgi:cytochrome c oxidase subunit 2